jgi:hypothetical protein
MADDRFELSQVRVVDPVIEAYIKDIDRTLIRERLKRTPAERVDEFVAFARAIDSVRGAAQRKR